MKRNHTQTFTRDDGTQVICATDANGERLPTRYVRDGQEAAPAKPKKEPRLQSNRPLKQLASNTNGKGRRLKLMGDQTIQSYHENNG